MENVRGALLTRYEDIRNKVDGEGSLFSERKIHKRAGCTPIAARREHHLDECIVHGDVDRAQPRVDLSRVIWKDGVDFGSFGANSSVDPVVAGISKGSRGCQIYAPGLKVRLLEGIRY